MQEACINRDKCLGLKVPFEAESYAVVRFSVSGAVRSRAIPQVLTKPSSSNATIDIPVDQARHPLARGAGGAWRDPGVHHLLGGPPGRSGRQEGTACLRGHHALVMPAFSFSITRLIVKLAGRCEGGNSTNDWAICAT
jgi:hypothetical protein